MSRWQYLSHAEPLATNRYADGSEQVDRWAPLLPTPGPARRLTAAILAGACFLVLQPPVVTVASVASWAQPLSSPVRIVARRPSELDVFAPVFVPTPVVTITLDRWYVQLALPVRAARRAVVGETIAPLHVVRRPSMSTWWPRMIEPVRRIRRCAVMAEYVGPLEPIVPVAPGFLGAWAINANTLIQRRGAGR